MRCQGGCREQRHAQEPGGGEVVGKNRRMHALVYGVVAMRPSMCCASPPPSPPPPTGNDRPRGPGPIWANTHINPYVVGPRGRAAAPTRGSVVNTLPGPGRVALS
eukprot:scaffold12984_cov125-Isochrysis_galbana.AAC.3